MNKAKKIIASVLVGIAGIGGMTACSSDADVVSHNLSKSAEQFEVNRRIVGFNGITDKYLIVVEGRCSLESADSFLAGALEITCKVGPDQYKKHFLGLSDNVSFFMEQIEAVDASEYYYRVIFKPETVVPDIDVETTATD